MKRSLSVIAAAATIIFAGMTLSSPVQARDDGAVIGGVIGGLAVGAIVGGAIAQQRGYNESDRGYGHQSRGYGYQPVYVGRREACVEQRQVWSSRYQGYVVRNVRVRC